MRGRIRTIKPLSSVMPLALLVVAGLVAPAQAQFFDFWGHRAPPWQQPAISRGAVRAIVYQRGMHLLDPPRRNGNVYVADTEDRYGHSYRLIIDASNGRVLEIFRTSGPASSPPRDARALEKHRAFLARQAKHRPHHVVARAHVKHLPHGTMTTTPVLTVPKAQVPSEAAAPVSKPAAPPATVAIAPVAAHVTAPATPAPKIPVAPVVPAKPAASATDHKINDVPVAPLD